MQQNAAAIRPLPGCQLEVLTDMSALVQELIDDHRARRRLWFPNDFLNADSDKDCNDAAELRERARAIPSAVRVSLALNLLTEEGLPHFHRLLSQYLGDSGPWLDWTLMWTAEEDRHGCAMRDYVREARIFNMGSLERLQYAYLEAGFFPDWGDDLYKIVAYTSLQERATQKAHANTARQCAAHEPLIQNILSNICADEGRHYRFYRQCFAAIIERDPHGALQALTSVAPALAMPGHTIKGYSEMSEVVRRSGIFGPIEYASLLQELLEFWQIDSLTGLPPDTERLQEQLIALPAKLRRIGEHRASRSSPRAFEFGFLSESGLMI